MSGTENPWSIKEELGDRRLSSPPPATQLGMTSRLLRGLLEEANSITG